MSPLLIALLGVMLVPLFVATWRTSLLGLACQGLLLAWLAYDVLMFKPLAGLEVWMFKTLARLETMPDLATASQAGAWLTLFDLAVIRGLVAPAALYAVLRARAQPSRDDVLPPNLLTWTLALGIVLVAFTVSESLVAAAGQQQTLVFVAVAGLLLGFLVLSTQSSPLSQMIGLLRIENAIALFELGGEPEPALGIQLAQVAVVVATIALFRWYLKSVSSASGISAAEAVADGAGAGDALVEGPTL